MPLKSRKAAAAPSAADRESSRATLTPTGDKQSAPRVGRTPGMGAKAERPSEGKDRKVENTKAVEPARSSKAPSAANRALKQQRQRKAG